MLLVALVAGIYFATRRRPEPLPSTGDFRTAASVPVEAPPPPAAVVEGRTIKMHAPPAGTLKLLPGWLEVVSGDDVVKEIRFYKPKGEGAAETTFGRAEGRPYVHVQLKPMTVSSRQAKVSFEGGVASLTNYATNASNPTRVNDREMAVEEKVALADGDKVEMGEVVFRFHTGARPA